MHPLVLTIWTIIKSWFFHQTTLTKRMIGRSSQYESQQKSAAWRKKKGVDLGDGEQKEIKLHEIFDFISLKDTYVVCTNKKNNKHTVKRAWRNAVKTWIVAVILLNDTYFVLWKRVKNEETKQPRFSNLGCFVSA